MKASRQASTASAASNAGVTKIAVKTVSGGGVAIRASAKTPFGTDIGVVVVAVTGGIRYKNKGAGKKKDVVKGTGKDASKRSRIWALEFTL